MIRYYAHSAGDRPQELWQPLADHLRGTAARARRMAFEAFPGDEDFAHRAYAAGLLHDLGKYRPQFQEMLRGFRGKGLNTVHKQAGAARAQQLRGVPLAYAIAGHHGHIPDRESLRELIAGESGIALADQIWPVAQQDCPELATLRLDAMAQERDPLMFDLRVRFLFSCLVDADWQDTSDYYDRLHGREPEPPPERLHPENRLVRVQAYLKRLASRESGSPVCQIRGEILEAALLAAESQPGMFSLTVPTGGGKTLASLAFALAHAARYGLRRVIYVTPFLSILEQNARVMREALELSLGSPDLFEHHSLSEPGDGESNEEEAIDERCSEIRRRAENWDAPLIVTTSVQFFESLFSAKPGRCRKLHNLARSVIVLDECQSLPPGLIAPSCSVLNSLATTAGASVVLCTATQPAWHRRSGLETGLTNVRELAPAPGDLFRRLVRVRVRWPQHEEAPWSWEEVVERMLYDRAALTVVNTKRAARSVFQLLRAVQPTTAFHLSTSMCPAHRLQVIDRVRDRLAKGNPCYLVSTQLIEAGVDLDFPCVLRELAPLEAIIQAAGRCNREGRLNAIDNEPGGRVHAFRARQGSSLVEWYRRGTQVLETEFLAAGREPDIGDPEQITEYFVRLYKTGTLDEHQLQMARERQQFDAVSRKYRLIQDAGIAVAVPSWREAAERIAALLTALESRPSRRLYRQLARFQVNVQTHYAGAAANLVEHAGWGIPVWLGQYDDDTGIVAAEQGDWVC